MERDPKATTAYAPVWERPGGWALGSFRLRSGEIRAGLVLDDAMFELTGLPQLTRHAAGGQLSVRSLLEEWDDSFPRLEEVAAEIRETAHHDSARTSLTDVEVLAPVQPPGQVFQSGANYRQHVIDLLVAQRVGVAEGTDDDELRRRSVDTVDERIAQDLPYVFLGLPSAICGPQDEVLLPATGSEHDWELELAAVIGRSARHVPRDEALSYVAGYTICNDLTTRDLVYRDDLRAIGTDWLRSKNWPTALPTGPFMVPAAFVPDPMALRITLRLNGRVMQDESSADMVFGIDRLIEHVSTIAELRPGDMLLTGSPAGNGAHWNRFLRPGDVMEAEISGLGRQTNRCIAS